MTTEPVAGNEFIAYEAPTLRETSEEIEYEMRSAEGAMWTGGRLVIGIGAFFFGSLAFAYFYLRSSNNEELWRPNHITAPTGIGAAVFAFVVASALLYGYGTTRLRAGNTLDWEVTGWVTVLGGFTALGLQVWEFTQLSFFPGSSGYASCFIAWGVMNTALILGGLYWLETLLARWLRLRRAVLDDGGPARSTMPVARLFRANLEGCWYFWGFIAFVNLVFWVLFYVI
jgi:heme/copper-type cytochrome/quinol oxidase subunit 3